MAPTIKWQRFDSASYNWFGQNSTDALPQIEAEIDAWIAAVNGNASNAGRQITKLRGAADSTGGNYAGLVLRFGANGNTEYGYFKTGCFNSTSAREWFAGITYSDDTADGGYGNVTDGPSYTSLSYRTSGYEGDFLICSGTVDGQEYLTWGTAFQASKYYMDGFTIFKTTTGEWAFTCSDGSATNKGLTYFNDAFSTGWLSFSRDESGYGSAIMGSSGTFSRYGVTMSSTSFPSMLGTPYTMAASSDLVAVQNSSTYQQTGTRRTMSDLSPDGDVFLLSAYSFGPTLFVDLRP